jgi:hypothetical protein
VESDAFLVLESLGSFTATLCLSFLAHFVVAVAHGIPHTGILWPSIWKNIRSKCLENLLGESCIGVVVRCIAVHLIDLVCLPKAIPSPEVCRVCVYCCSIALNGSTGVFHFQILVPHQSPRRDELTVQLDGPHEVESTLLVISSQTVVITDDTAGLWPVLVVLEDVEGQVGELSIIFFDVQNV